MEKLTENKENITRACLQLNDKIYPVYEGHNTIGRNPDAVINIKNLNVSKIHAVLTVLEQDSHYLSDFKSSNGTFLDGRKLAPLQVYKLSDGASVKFGDVLGTYKKIDDGKLARKSFAESQMCSESFYGASTQEACLVDLPDGINFNEMPTQIFTAKDLSINEMPTQMHNFEDLDDSSDESVDLMTMQKSSESQMFISDKNTINRANDPTASTVPPTANSKNLAESDTDDGTPDDVMFSNEKNANDLTASTVQPTSNSKNLAESDTDDVIPDDVATQESIIRSRARNLQKIADSEASETDDDLTPSSQIKPVKIGKKAIESESDTDDYDYKDCKMDSRYDISEDSETDVDEKGLQNDEDLNAPQASPKLEEKENNHTEVADDDKIEESAAPRRLSKKVLPQDHLYCQAVSQTQEMFEKEEERLSLEKQAEEDGNQSEAAKDEDLPETEIGEIENQMKEGSQGEKVSTLQEKSQDKKEHEENLLVSDAVEEESHDQNVEDIANSAEKSDQIISGKDSQETSSLPMLQKDEDNEQDIFDEATQVLDFDFADDDETQPKEEIPRPVEDTIGCQSEEGERRKKSSQEDENLNDEKISEEDKLMGSLDIGNALHSGDGIRKDYDVYLQSTQTLDILKETKDAPSPDFFDDDDDDGIFMQPTQILEKSISASKDLKSMKQASKEEIDEIFLHPTQALENLHGEEPMLKPIVEEDETDTQELEAILADEETKKVAEEEMLPPTQSLELLHGEDQISDMEKSLTEKSDNEDLFLPPTQALENLLSEDLVEKDVFRLPKPSPAKKKSPRRKVTREKSPVEDDDDSFILQPTQALEILHDDGTPFNKVEDQLHEIFASQSMLCTQQLVDVLDTSKDGEVIEDSMLLDRSRKLESLTEETVKDILEDGGDENVALVVNRLSGNRGVRTYSKINEDGEASTSSRKVIRRRKKSVDGAKGMRRSRRRQDSASSSERNEEDTNEESPVRDRKTGRGKRESDKPETSEVVSGSNRRELEEDEEQESKIEGDKDSQNSTSSSAPDKKEKESKIEEKDSKSSSSSEKSTRSRRKQNLNVSDDRESSMKSVKRTVRKNVRGKSNDKEDSVSVSSQDESEGRPQMTKKHTLEVIEESRSSVELSLSNDDGDGSSGRSVKKQNVGPVTTRRTRGAPQAQPEELQEQASSSNDDGRRNVKSNKKQKDNGEPVRTKRTRGAPEVKSKELEEELGGSDDDGRGSGKSDKKEKETEEPVMAMRTRATPEVVQQKESEQSSGNKVESQGRSKVIKKQNVLNEQPVRRRTRAASEVEPKELEQSNDNNDGSQGRSKISKKQNTENEEPVRPRRTRGTSEVEPKELEESSDNNDSSQGKSKIGKKQKVENEELVRQRRTRGTSEVEPKGLEQSNDNNNDGQGTSKTTKKKNSKNEEPVRQRRTRGTPEVQPKELEESSDNNDNSQGKSKISKKQNLENEEPVRQRRTRGTTETEPKGLEQSNDNNGDTQGKSKISKKQNVESEEPVGRRTRAAPEVQPKESEQSSDNTDDGQGKSKINKKQNVENEEPARKRRTRATPDVSEEQTERPKRKKAAADEPPETPKKKKPVASSGDTKSPKKRGLKLPSDSEDEFEAKVQKVEKTPPKSKKAKEEDSVSMGSASQQTVSSTSSTESAKTRRLSANSRRLKREEEEKKTGVVATPERSKRTVKPKVVFTMMDNPELESLIRQLGGSVVDTVDSCTVLVTGSVKRSQKLLCAVAQGKPVCSTQWLQACKKAYAFVDPWDYLLVDKDAEKKWNFSLREAITRAANAKLLQDHTFQIMVGKGNDSEKVLKGAIEACGGKCVTKNLATSESEHLIVVATENQKTSYNRLVKQNPNIKVVQTEAIFDGTLRQEFRFDEFLMR